MSITMLQYISMHERGTKFFDKEGGRIRDASELRRALRINNFVFLEEPQPQPTPESAAAP